MSRLLDQFGRPIRPKALTRKIAEPGLTGVRTAWAPSVTSGLTPAALSTLLKNSAEGDLNDYLGLAEEMEERDPHYASVLGIRKRAISGVTPVVKPASDAAVDVKIADDVRKEIAEHNGFSDLIEDMLDALGKGFSVVEIDWEKTAKKWWPREFVYRDPRFFMFDKETGREIRLLDEGDMVDGIELEPFKFICHKAKLKSGLAVRGGLARLAAFGWMCKSYAMKDWIAFVETYGLPLRLGRYGHGATPEDVEILFSAVANIGTDAAAVLPESMRIDFEQVATGPGSDIFEKFARWSDEQMSKAVLGQTMTSDNGSSKAQAAVHNEVRHDIAASDAKSVSGTLNRDLVKPYVDLNYGLQQDYPSISIIIEEAEDTDMILRNTFEGVAKGLRVKQSEVRARLGYSEPDEDDDVLRVPAASESPVTEIAKNRIEDGPVAEDDLENGWHDVMDDVLDPIIALLEDAAGYDEALRLIKSAFPDLGSDVLISALVKAGVMARAQGEKSDGAGGF